MIVKYEEFLNEGLFSGYHDDDIKKLFEFIKRTFNYDNLTKLNDDIDFEYNINGTILRLVIHRRRELDEKYKILIDQELLDISYFLKRKIYKWFLYKYKNREKEEVKIRKERENRRMKAKMDDLKTKLSNIVKDEEDDFEKDFEQNEGIFIKRYHQEEMEKLYKYIKDNFDINKLTKNEDRNVRHYLCYFYQIDDNNTLIVNDIGAPDVWLNDEELDISRWLKIKIAGFFNNKWENKEKEEAKLQKELANRRKLNSLQDINKSLIEDDEQFEDE